MDPSTQPKLHDIDDIVASPIPWLWIILAVLAAIAIIGLLVWWWRRRKARKKIAVVNPFDVWCGEVEEFHPDGWAEERIRKEFCAVASRNIRAALEKLSGTPFTDMTLPEVQESLLRHHVRGVIKDDVLHVLKTVDQIQFADHAVDAEKLTQIKQSVVKIIRQAEREHQSNQMTQKDGGKG
jgi:hypothetical protein